MLKQNKGITLIALVIIIVILLVLAGVVVNLSMGENGLIGKAKTAVDKYKQASQNEQILIAKYENEIEGYISGNRDYELEIKKLNERIAELENFNSYSTDEKVVGTWIDGKPLYQKTISKVHRVITDWTNFETVLNAENIKIISGSIEMYPFLHPNFEFYTDINGVIKICTNSSAYSGDRNVVITIQYTKTTDSLPNGN